MVDADIYTITPPACTITWHGSAHLDTGFKSPSHPKSAPQSLASYFFYSFDVITTMMTLEGAPLTLAHAPYLPEGEVAIASCWELLRNTVRLGGIHWRAYQQSLALDPA